MAFSIKIIVSYLETNKIAISETERKENMSVESRIITINIM